MSRKEPAVAKADSLSQNSAKPVTVHGASVIADLKQHWPILLLAVVLFILFRWLCVDVPLERDEGEYAYIAQRMLHGEVPYRDNFNQKPPAVFAAYLIPIWLCGTSIAAIHVTTFLWTAGTAVFLFLLARELTGARAAAISVVFFSVLSITREWQAIAANTEIFMILPMTAATWCVGRAIRLDQLNPAGAPWGWWLAAGILSLLAAFFKQVAIANVGFLACWSFFALRSHRTESSLRSLLPAVSWFVAGMAVVGLTVSLIFVSLGAGREFFDCVLWHNLKYSQYVGMQLAWLNLRDAISVQAGALWGVWLLTALALLDLRRERRGFTSLLACWLFFSAIGVSIGFYYREHYFVQFAPVFALACGATLDRWTARSTERLPSIAAGALTALVATVCLLTWFMPNIDFWFRSDPSWKSRLMYAPNPFPESAAIAGRLKELTGPDDQVLIYGSEPQILFLAERKSATRYMLFYPVTMALPGARERQQEVIRELETHRPKVLIESHLSTSLLMTPQTPLLFDEAFSKLRDEEYKLAGFRQFNYANLTSELVFQPDAHLELSSRRALLQEDRSGQFRFDMLVYVRK